MTIAISIKVNDGLVLAADSASTVFTQAPTGETGVLMVYNNADKIFNLRRGLPVGAVTFGVGSIGNTSISTLAKDLRRRLAGEDPAYEDWQINSQTLNIENVAYKVKEFFFEEMYAPAFADWEEKPTLGFLVSGYSAGAGAAEEYHVTNESGDFTVSCGRSLEDTGITWGGDGAEAVARLTLGFSPQLPAILQSDFGVPEADLIQVINAFRRQLQASVVIPSMPIQDAIDLADFLVDTAIRFSRFTLGPATVGGPIEIAAITKHEGFKWVKRKHYFDAQLNPGEINVNSSL
ncbi:MAG: hypothetical protein H6642_07115 [Caldilineaceae bacterium]|nr:hypothetical protein [Caldilineaceae bacterium]